ncbi:MAG: enoyl-CoA hydratase [Planctomycetota bacterium]|jgi:enoyl-CoA hydratase
MYTLKLDFPGRNALSPTVLEHLEQGLDAAAGEPLLLCGTEQAFSAGLDLRHVLSLSLIEMHAFLVRVDRIAERLYEYSAPTAALVEGHAIAGGCVLAQCCDFRVASPSPKARMGVSELALGAAFPPRILKLMEQRLPPQSVALVVLGAELYDMPGALAKGLLDEVTVDAADKARAYLERVGSYPREAFAASKSGLRKGRLTPSAADERRFAEQEVPMWKSPELIARVQAMLG